jgi:hypothetical protein
VFSAPVRAISGSSKLHEAGSASVEGNLGLSDDSFVSGILLPCPFVWKNSFLTSTYFAKIEAIAFKIKDK